MMKIFRKGGLVLLLILGGLTAAAMYFFTDDWIENQVERVLSVQNGALVEFDDFSLKIFKGELSWGRLQVGSSDDLMKNRFETGTTSVQIQAWKLLQKKVIIDEVTLSELRTGTDRTTSGEIPPEWIPEEEPIDTTESAIAKAAKERTQAAQRAIRNEIEQQPIFQLANTSVNADSLIAALNLTSPQKIDSLKQALSAQVESISTSVDDLKIQQTASEMEQKLKGIDVKEIKDVKEVEKTLSSLESINKDAKELKTRVENAKTQLNEGQAVLQSGSGQIDDWIQADYQKAREAAKLPDFDSQKIGELLLGPELMVQINTYLGYAATGRTYLAYFPSSEEEEKADRLKGQQVLFPLYEANPNFWIKKVNLDYTTSGGVALKGTVSDIIDRQKLIDRPTLLEVDGTNELGEALTLNGEFNYLGEEPKESFTFSMPKVSLRTLKLGGGGSLPSGFEKGNGNVTANLTILSGTPNALITMNNSGVEFKFDKKPSSKPEKTFQNIMNRINKFDVTAKLRTTNGKPKISIDSDIDNQVSRQIKAVASAEVNKVKRQIQAKVDSQVNAKKQELTQAIDQQKQQLEAKKQALQAEVTKQLAALEEKKKELEAKKEELIQAQKNKGKELLKSKIKF